MPRKNGLRDGVKSMLGMGGLHIVIVITKDQSCEDEQTREMDAGHSTMRSPDLYKIHLVTAGVWG